VTGATRPTRYLSQTPKKIVEEEDDENRVVVLPAKKPTEHYFMSVTFTLMGFGCMVAPQPILNLSLIPPVPTDLTTVTIFQCFGAQATLLGIVLANCHLTQKGYRNWILAILPFFYFDYYAYAVLEKVTLLGALGDATGNVIFTYCGWKCIQKLKQFEQKQQTH
jgi:hypothetical protein